MKVSRFNYLVKSPREENVHFLYNSLHDHRIAIEDGEVKVEKLFEKVQQGQELSAAENEAAQNLKELGVVLEDEDNEEAVFNQYLNDKVREQNEVLTITLLTTLACNLRCTYCYEKERLGKSKMSEETLEKAIQWIKNRIIHTSPKKLDIIFFGGEPLLHTEAIRKVGKALLPFCEERGIVFQPGVVTNGIFLTPELVDELKTYGLKWVKITFDGDQCEHDQKRIYSDGRGTFGKIFSNLEAIAGKLKIYIGGNFSVDSADSFKKLMLKLKYAKFSKDVVSNNFKPIIEEIKQQEDGNVGSSCIHDGYNEQETDKLIELKKFSQDLGLTTLDPVNTGPCEYYLRNSVAIGLKGELYSCVPFAGIEGTSIGNVEQQEFNEIGESMLHSSKPFDHPKCSKCPFPPICGGGCRAWAYTTTGTYENISCNQDHFKRVVAQGLALEHYEGAQWANAPKL